MKEKHDLINLIEDIQGYEPDCYFNSATMTSHNEGKWLIREDVIKIIKKYLRKEEKK